MIIPRIQGHLLSHNVAIPYIDTVDGVERKPAQHEEEHDDGEVFGGLDLLAGHLTAGAGSVATAFSSALRQVREKRHAAHLAADALSSDTGGRCRDHTVH